MKTIIAGSRKQNNIVAVKIAIELSGFEITEIVSGHASGIDLAGERYAKDNDIPIKLFPANWDVYGKVAGPMRNEQMAYYAEALIAIPDKESRGTWDMVNKAKNEGLKVYVYEGLLK